MSAPVDDGKITKIRALIALATPPVLEEGRTSAFLALKMARDLGLEIVVVQPGTSTPDTPSARTGPTTSPPSAGSTSNPGRCRVCQGPTTLVTRSPG